MLSDFGVGDPPVVCDFGPLPAGFPGCAVRENQQADHYHASIIWASWMPSRTGGAWSEASSYGCSEANGGAVCTLRCNSARQAE